MKHIYIIALVLLLIPAASAQIQLDGISTDPAVLAAGDSVDVIIEYSTGAYNDKFSSENYKFLVELVADDIQTQEFVRITDPTGVSRFRTLPAGATRTQVFRIKISEDAPADSYAFKLRGVWQEDGVTKEAALTQRFFLDVKREAIRLSAADITSEPKRLVPGTREAVLQVDIANSGVKSAHNLEVTARFPDKIRPSHASAHRTYIGSVSALKSSTAQFVVDLDKDLSSGEHRVQYVLRYTDDSQNNYEKILDAPLYISQKPRLVVESLSSQASTAQQVDIVLNISNHGVVAAEAIDVRLLTESNQPFSLQTRSGYIGKLYPGESTVLTLQAVVDRHATAGEYNIPVLVRAKGDSDENDNTIYTYRSRALITVSERSTNTYVAYLIAAVIVFSALFAWRKLR